MISVYDRVASPSLSREGLKKKSQRRAPAFLIAGCLLFGMASHAQALEFFAIVANLNNAQLPHAQMDVAVDTVVAPGTSSPVLFNVYAPNDVQLADFVAETNPNGFASSSSVALPPASEVKRYVNPAQSLMPSRLYRLSSSDFSDPTEGPVGFNQSDVQFGSESLASTAMTTGVSTIVVTEERKRGVRGGERCLAQRGSRALEDDSFGKQQRSRRA